MENERRLSKRYHARLGVVFSDQGQLSFSFITNLSRTGAFLSTRNLFSVGSTVQMYLSNGALDAPIEGRVVRVSRGSMPLATTATAEAPATSLAAEPGMGIVFDRLGPTAKRLRDDLLLYSMNLKYHHHWD